MNKKALGRVTVKDADQGLVTAVFSSFHKIDADDDVTMPGAFDDGAEWMISAYGHKSWDGALPVGKGVVRTTDTEAILEGQFFMDTQAGRETFLVVKNMGSLQEWSYSCDPDKYSFGEFEGKQVRFLEHIRPGGEVSPVIKGAGVGTRSLAVKSSESLHHELEAALEAMGVVSGAFDSARRVDALRAEKGKTLSRVNSDALDRLGDQLRKASDAYAALKADRERQETETTPPNALQLEWLRHVARLRGIHA